MTKAELQSALAAAAQTDKKTAGVFLDTLSDIAYKATKKGSVATFRFCRKTPRFRDFAEKANR